jgi:hypothetical protein
MTAYAKPANKRLVFQCAHTEYTQLHTHHVQHTHMYTPHICSLRLRLLGEVLELYSDQAY